MSYNEIIYLLEKYSTKQPGEKWSNDADLKYLNLKIKKEGDM